jgi:hypothetical protein
MKRIVLSLLIGFLVFSCSSDKSSGEPKTETLYLSQIYKDGVLERTYSYYGDNKLKEESVYNSNGNIKIYNYTYSNGKVTYTFEDGKNITYETNNTVRSDSFDKDGNLTSFRVYSNLDSGCGYSLIEWFTATGELRFYHKREVIDENCSKDGIAYNSKNEITATYTNIYDGKKFNREFKGSFLSKNENVGNRKEYYQYDTTGNLTYSSKSTFTYNDDGYPTSETRVDSNGNTTDYTYGYK